MVNLALIEWVAANLSGTFKQEKNVLVIGGTNNLGHVEPLNSKGPAYNGRIQPELVAFGIDGTSGAAAIVSGTCALLQEFHKVYKRKPSSALLRALLINSADDAGKPRVDIRHFNDYTRKRYQRCLFFWQRRQQAALKTQFQ